MAHNFSVRARKLAWSCHDDKYTPTITRIRRVGTDSTLNDDDDSVSVSSSIRRMQMSEDVDRFTSALRKDGCVILENFTDLQLLQKAEKEIQMWAQIRNNEATGHATPLIKQSSTVRNDFLANDVYQELCKEFLTVETTKWKNGRSLTEMCKPILSSAETWMLPSTNAACPLARHDTTLAIKHQEHEKYQDGQDAMLGLIMPSSEPIQVRAALGSHLCGSQNLDFGKDVVEVTLEVGQALIVLGSLYHQVTAQSGRDEKAEPALAYLIWSCAGVYRPEEQVALMINAAELKMYPAIIQERLR